MKYNGVSLPASPGYATAVYPYACIVESALLAGVYTLYICSEPFYYSAAEGNVRTVAGASLSTSKLTSGASAWGEIENMDSIAGTTGFTPFWCNVDILDEDGAVYLAGSEPVKEAREIQQYFRLINRLIGFVIGLAGDPLQK